MTRVLRDTAATLSAVLPGAPTGSVDVTVKRADGTTLATGTATVTGTDATFPLAPQSTLDHLTITWSATISGVTQVVTTYAELVGAHYFSLAELRAMDGLTSTTDFPDEDLTDVRDRVENRIEGYAHNAVAFVPRFHRESISGRGCAEILLAKRYPRDLIKVEHLDGSGVATEQTTTTWRLDDTGLVWRPNGFFPAGTRNIVVAYEHGHDSPPQDLRDAALEAARQHLLDRYSTLSPRAASLDTEFGGTVRFDLIPDERRGRIFGMPDVDATIRTHLRPLPGVA